MVKQQVRTPATMADIAAAAGVSVSTVSRALAGSTLVARKKRELIAKLAEEHGYVMNVTARGLRLKRTDTLSVVIPLAHESGQQLTDPFFVTMLGHLADEITRRGYRMFLQKVTRPDPRWLDTLIGAQHSDGIIVIGQSTVAKALESAASRYLPLVVWGGHLATKQAYCTVGTDNVAAARRAVEHLVETGRRRILFLGDPGAPEIALRRDGYLEALQGAPRGLAPACVIPTHLTPGAAYESMRAAIRSGKKFDAVFAATDVIAISAMRAITDSGLTVPDDVAVVGFDDIAIAAHTTPPLSTVRQDVERGAKVLVDLLLRRIAGEKTASSTVPFELVIRKSSARAAAAPRS